MDIKITNKGIEPTGAIKEYIEKKAERLSKYFEEELKINVTLKQEGNEDVAEMDFRCEGEDYRATESHKDLYASIDKLIDVLEGQIRKTKSKKEKKTNNVETIREIFDVENEDSGVTNEIVKVLFYDIKPMTPEDAKMKLIEQKNTFLAYIDNETGRTNVIYKLKDNNNFGIVEPGV